MSNNAQSFVNGLNSSQLSVIAKHGELIQKLASNKLTNSFNQRIQKFTNYDNLKREVANTKYLTPGELQKLNQHKIKLFKNKVNKLVNINSLSPIVQNRSSYTNAERKLAFDRIQNLKRKFKNASRTPNEFKTGLAKFGVNARKGISNLRRSTGEGLSELRNKSKGFMSMFRRP
jgi:hypothetical protein